MVGIYMIRCKPNNKIYVGQSMNISKRWKQHRIDLNGGYHTNEELQKDWNNYGEDNFEFKIVQKCKEEYLDELEIIHIEQFKAFEYGYNETIGGKGSFGFKHSESTKDKMKKPKSEIARKHMSETKSIKIVQLDKDMRLIATFNSSKEASEILGFDQGHINECCNGKRKTHKGFMWMFYEDYIKLNKKRGNVKYV